LRGSHLPGGQLREYKPNALGQQEAGSRVGHAAQPAVEVAGSGQAGPGIETERLIRCQHPVEAEQGFEAGMLAQEHMQIAGRVQPLLEADQFGCGQGRIRDLPLTPMALEVTLREGIQAQRGQELQATPDGQPLRHAGWQTFRESRLPITGQTPADAAYNRSEKRRRSSLTRRPEFRYAASTAGRQHPVLSGISNLWMEFPVFRLETASCPGPVSSSSREVP
jgi:hypothetical protein